jgi:predicted nucleic acid-binding protein
LDENAAEFIQLLRVTASVVRDGPDPPRASADPGDDYLIALATKSASVLVSGDRDLLAQAPGLPVHAPSALLAMLPRQMRFVDCRVSWRNQGSAVGL